MDNVLDHLWIRVRAKAGICRGIDIATMRDYLKKGKDYSKYAAYSGRFASLHPEHLQQFKKAADALDNLSKTIKTVDDAAAAWQIADAICTLSKWVEPDTRVTPAEAAKAFDQLFGGAANLANKLPGPLASFAKILSEISKQNFFAKMEQIGYGTGNVSPADRPQMERIMREIDSVGRPAQPVDISPR